MFDLMGGRLGPVPFWVWLALIWAALYLPPVGFRSLYWEEGRRALMALDILREGHWLQPRVLGVPYLNKPPLLPWLIALGGWISGGIDVWAVRLPPLLMTLAGALLVQNAARRYTTRGHSLLAGLAFLLSPMILEKAAVGETDTTVTAASFAAFLTWAGGLGRTRNGLGRWIGCSFLLCLVALAKGPIPLAYFALGVILYDLATGRRSDLGGLVLALLPPLALVAAWALAVHQPGDTHVWLKEMRLVIYPKPLWFYLARPFLFLGELLLVLCPWLILASPTIAPRAWLNRKPGREAQTDLTRALICYAAGFSAALLFWPDSQTRYAMPAVPALALAVGLAGEKIRRSRWLRCLMILSLIGGIGYQLALSYVHLPLNRERYTASRRAGRELAAILDKAPGPAYLMALEDHHNVMFHLGRQVRELEPKQADRLRGPGWLILSPPLPQGRGRLPGRQDRPAGGPGGGPQGADAAGAAPGWGPGPTGPGRGSIPLNVPEPTMSLWLKAVREKQGLIIAHRGARSLAPENTLLAAELAFGLGAHGWELDIRITADGVPVVIHDAFLRRTSDVEEHFPQDYPWETDRYDYETLRGLDFGSWFKETDPFGQIKAGEVSPAQLGAHRGCPIPTLDQALELTRRRDRLVNLEIKDLTGREGHASVAEKAVAAAARTGARERVLISSFNLDYLDRIRFLDPNLPLGLLQDRYRPDPLNLIRRSPARFFHPRSDSVTPEQLRELNWAGVPVLVWTVNDPAQARELMGAGAAGVITDFPQLFKGIEL